MIELVVIISLKASLCELLADKSGILQQLAAASDLLRRASGAREHVNATELRAGGIASRVARCETMERAQEQSQALLAEADAIVAMQEILAAAKDELRGEFGHIGMVGVAAGAGPGTAAMLGGWPGWGVAALDGAGMGDPTPALEEAAAALARLLRADGEAAAAAAALGVAAGMFPAA